MAVMKPDTFDVENKRVPNQLGLIKRAIGGGAANVFLLRRPFEASGFSVNDSETVRLLSVVIKNGCDLAVCFCADLNNVGRGQYGVCGGLSFGVTFGPMWF